MLGGDHSIAIGSFAGVASYYKKKQETVGLIWFDAHADMNTPDSTPSGNIHGMPLAALLVTARRNSLMSLVFHQNSILVCAHVGARDIDPGESEMIRELGNSLLYHERDR